MTIISERIAERLDELGWEPIQLAARVGVSEITARRWYSGRFDPEAGRILAIARVLEVDPLWLLGGEPLDT